MNAHLSRRSSDRDWNEAMAFASVTRLRARSFRFLPTILLHTWRTKRQLRQSGGFLGGYLATGPGLALWTVTLWEDEISMLAFRNAQAHLRAMPDLIGSCDEASYAHWTSATGNIPDPGEAAERLRQGRTSKLRFPSPAHASGETWPDRKVPREGASL